MTRRCVVLLVVLSATVVVGLSVPATAAASTTATVPCSGMASTTVDWHLQQYGSGCETDDGRDARPFPAGETVTRIGEPPWVPL